MSNHYNIINYEITTDEALLDEQNHLTPFLKKKLQKLYKIATKGNLKKKDIFYELIEKYPKNPQLKNYLSTLYSKGGNDEKAFEINHWIIKEHPNYLFGKINMANEYYIKHEYHKIPEVLGEYMDIQKLFPNRNVFHYIEVNSFLFTAIKYFSAINEFDEAEARLKILKEIDVDEQYYDEASKIIMLHLSIAAMKKAEEENKNRIIVEHNSAYKYNQILTEPVFTHKEIKALYEHDIDINPEVLENLLRLPKKTLQEDLEKVLLDSLNRYDYYLLMEQRFGYIPKDFAFVIHALFLLKEIKATSSLPIILDVLRQDEVYIDLFISDFITEVVWLVIYNLAQDSLDILKNFMLEDGIYTYSKGAVLSSVEQYYQHKTHAEDTIINWYKDIINTFLKADINDNLIDSTLNGFLISGLIDMNATELIFLIKQLYDKEIVDLFACGDFDTVKKLITKKNNEQQPLQIQSIFEIYDYYTPSDDFSNDFLDDNYKKYIDDVVETITNKTKKVGRNEPCHCGSGKKYKKCCINK
jgi:hypothetical protein